jgi:hypothetical protein
VDGRTGKEGGRKGKEGGRKELSLWTKLLCHYTDTVTIVIINNQLSRERSAERMGG